LLNIDDYLVLDKVYYYKSTNIH